MKCYKVAEGKSECWQTNCLCEEPSLDQKLILKLSSGFFYPKQARGRGVLRDTSTDVSVSEHGKLGAILLYFSV